MKAFEVNFDGLVGPTHNYSGLSFGNLASMSNQESLANPKAAALQGLEKMKLISSLGIVQGVLPPHERPHLPTLRRLGFTGSDSSVISAAFKQDPNLLFAVSSAAAMWTANAATVSSSFDSLDKKIHILPANLASNIHRSIEAEFTSIILNIIFKNTVHHPHLPISKEFADEGAANHTRFCTDYSSPGIHLFVYGRRAWEINEYSPKIFPARQTFEASQSTARLLKIPESNIVYARQHPEAIDAGVFHNDVASVGNKNVFLYHEKAFVDENLIIQALKNRLPELIPIRISNNQVSLSDAVSSYLFNSQLLSTEDGMILLAPSECEDYPSVKAQLEQIVQDKSNPIYKIIYINLKESMRNGGGPACLRLRVVLSSEELQKVHPSVIYTTTLHEKLKDWILKKYRDRLLPDDLADPELLLQTQSALDELSKILKLGSIYSFQK